MNSSKRDGITATAKRNAVLILADGQTFGDKELVTQVAVWERLF